MSLEKVLDLIAGSVDRLLRATEASERNEKWWTHIAKEDWNLIQLSWELRGVILRRRKGTEGVLDLNDKARKELEEILKEAARRKTEQSALFDF